MDIHMGVVSYTIWKILERYKTRVPDAKSDDGRPPPIRIGHGIGFYQYIERNEFKDATDSKGERVAKRQRFRNFVNLALQAMREWRIPIEVCPTSSEYLQGTRLATAATNEQGYFNPDFLKSCLLHGFHVIVATDNDGIWPIELKIGAERFHSVASELLIAADGANEGTALTGDQVDQLVSNFQSAAFGSPDLCRCVRAVVRVVM